MIYSKNFLAYFYFHDKLLLDMTYPKGYNPPSSPGDTRPTSSPDRKGHRGAAVALIIIFILIIAGVGIYSATRPHQTNTSPSTPLPSSQPSSLVTETAQSGDCDPSYPDFCIPSPPPDLNCADVSQKRFTVSGSDPHGFDRDGDGVGCES
jgi:hypothetical protein